MLTAALLQGGLVMPAPDPALGPQKPPKPYKAPLVERMLKRFPRLYWPYIRMRNKFRFWRRKGHSWLKLTSSF